MAVYTHVPEAALKAHLAAYDIGELISYEGVEQGVENTNYILTVAKRGEPRKFVLTLFERRVAETDIPFFLDAMAHFAGCGLPAPTPAPSVAGALTARLEGRPAVIITFLDGAPRMTPGPADCRALGEVLAKMHLAGEDFAPRRENDLGLAGWRRLFAAIGPRADELAPGLRDLIEDELEYLSAATPRGLPAGLVHADLFPDNIFFRNGAVTGVIDFYFACTDSFAYDLAVALNAWAGYDGGWRRDNAAALLEGYGARRTLSAGERAALPALLRGAALRFLLTRAYDAINQVEGAVVKIKDPLEFQRLLTHHRVQAEANANWLFAD